MADVHDLVLTHGVDVARAGARSAEERRLIEMAAAILASEDERMNVSHSGFAVTALPHRKPMDRAKANEVDVWRQSNGPTTLLARSGLEGDGQTPVGVPYGAYARHILVYLQTEAMRTKSREVELGASMNRFLGSLGLAVGGKTYRQIKEQSRRISACTLTFLYKDEHTDLRRNGAFVDTALFMSEPNVRQPQLWDDRVRLNEQFFNDLCRHAVPLRHDALAQIANKSMAIDIYIWLAYRLHHVKHQTQLGWPAVYGQFGAGFATQRQFKPEFMKSLRAALAVYPEARVETHQKTGLTLCPSPPPVRKRMVLLPGGKAEPRLAAG